MSTRRIILLVILGIFLILGGIAIYIGLTTKSHSPQARATYSNEGFQMSVVYCRPYKKGRVIFGTEEDGALQLYGKYWRLGANEATQISINQDVNFGGKDLAAGEYVVYAVPDVSSWKIGLNSEIGRWGVFEVDHELDIMQVSATPEISDKAYEQLTIAFEDIDSVTVHMNIMWDKIKVPVPIRRK